MSLLQRLWARLRGRPSDPDARARRAALAAYRADVAAAARTPDRDELARLAAQPAALGWPGEDVELETELLEASLEALTLRDAIAAGDLPVVVSQHRAIGSDTCHYTVPCFLASDGTDRTGRLFLTNERLLFASTPPLVSRWEAIRTVSAEGRDLRVQVAATTHVFRCNSFRDARCGLEMADAIRRRRSASR